MRSQLPPSLAGVVAFGGCAFFFIVTRGDLLGNELGAVMALLSVGMTLLAGFAAANLLRHEGWSVVITANTLELPTAPYKSSKRDRIPLASIEFVGLARDPRGEATAVMIHISPGPQIRWIRRADLSTGTVTEIASLLADRVTALRGEGRIVALA
jgi:hypothetical protein